MRCALALIIALCLLPAPAAAQDATPAPVTRRTRIAVGAAGTSDAAPRLEVERGVSPRASVAIGARPRSRWDRGSNPAIVGADASLRLYPGGRTLRGFNVGARAGYVRMTRPGLYFRGPTFPAPGITIPDHYHDDFVSALVGYDAVICRGLSLGGTISAEQSWSTDRSGIPFQVEGFRLRPHLALGWSF